MDVFPATLCRLGWPGSLGIYFSTRPAAVLNVQPSCDTCEQTVVLANFPTGRSQCGDNKTIGQNLGIPSISKTYYVLHCWSEITTTYFIYLNLQCTFLQLNLILKIVVHIRIDGTLLVPIFFYCKPFKTGVHIRFNGTLNLSNYNNLLLSLISSICALN